MQNPLASIQLALDELRSMQLDRELRADPVLVPSVFFDLDPAESEAELFLRSDVGEMFSAQVVLNKPGRWLTLTLELLRCDLSECGLIGIACESSATRSVPIQTFLRSGMEKGFRDTFFERTVIAYQERGAHVDALFIDRHPELIAEAPWRNLVFQFPVENFDITFHDIRLFAA